MTQAIAAPQPYYPQVDREIHPKVTVHLQRIYTAINDLDAAVVALNSKIAPAAGTKTTTTVVSPTTATTTTFEQAGVTSFNAITGAISYFPSMGQVNYQTGQTSYTTQSSDNGALVVLSDASPIAVSLNTTVATPWYATLVNQGTGLATLTPVSGTINLLPSLSLPGNSFTTVYFDGINFATSVPPAIFTRGGTILNPAVAINVVIWYAPFAATVTNVLGYVGGVAGSTINAQRNGSLPLLVSNLTLSSAGVWTDGGAVQNTAIGVGDKIEMMVISVAGAPTEIAVEIQCTRP